MPSKKVTPEEFIHQGEKKIYHEAGEEVHAECNLCRVSLEGRDGSVRACDTRIENGMVIFLPPDPMAAAAEVREDIRRLTGQSIGVIITDTCGRSFRRGQTGHAIGWSGMTAIRDFRGDIDLFGHVLKITEEAVVDEIAGFANFVMGESNNGVPAVIFRNCGTWAGHDDLYFRGDEDITKRVLKKEMDTQNMRSSA